MFSAAGVGEMQFAGLAVPEDLFCLAGSAKIQQDVGLSLLIAQLILDLILHSALTAQAQQSPPLPHSNKSIGRVCDDTCARRMHTHVSGAA